MNKFQLLPAAEYVADALKSVQDATTRIWLLSTILNEDDATAPLLEALRASAERGLDVHVAGDAYTFTEIGGHFKLSSQFNKRLRAVSRLKRLCEKSGIHFAWLGNDTSTLLNGRTHAKWLVIDDTVYSFGGTNLYQTGLESVDYMFKTVDHELAEKLVAEHKRIVTAVKNRHAYRSHKFEHGTSTVLVDGGFVGDSVIYRRACQLVKEAKSTVFVSQYCPNGRLGRLLKKKRAKVYFNPWNHANSLNALFIRVTSKLTGLRTAYHRPTYIHGKFIICTMEDGSKIAITGSHNFAQGGVWLGTREIALETSDLTIIDQLEDYLRKKIA